jgi:hypothetical protein
LKYFRKEKESGYNSITNLPRFPTKYIIIIDYNFKNYNFQELLSGIKLLLSSLECPCCKCRKLKKHDIYWKYYNRLPINILRVKCLICGKTHALIPAFSLPGTSLGSLEVERFLWDVHNGVPIYRARNHLSDFWQTEKYEYRFYKSIWKYFDRAKAIFSTQGDQSLFGMDWLLSVIGKTDRPLHDFNKY